MKHKRNLLALVLALMVAVSAACSGGGEELREPAQAGPAATGTTAPGVQESKETTIDQTVLYEADGIRVTATGYADGWMGPEISILVENESDRGVLVTTEELSVNGYMIPYSSLYAEVAAGKKANETLILMSSELDQSGIETVAELQFRVKVSDAESWEPLDRTELISLATSNTGFEQPVDDSGDVLYDEGGIRIICKGLKQDLIWDGTIVFFLENRSGRDITVSSENVSVNGFMQDAGMWSELRDGTRLVDGMSLIDLSDLQIESIDQVEQIEFSLRIIDSGTWDEIDTTDALVLTFE